MTRRLVLRIQRHTHTRVGSCRCASLFLRFKLLGERSDMRGDGRRESVVLDSEVVPNWQPSASIGSGNQRVLRSTICPRSASGMGCRPEVNWRKIGYVDMPTDPVVDPVGCLSHRHAGASLRVEGPFELRAAPDKPITDYHSN